MTDASGALPGGRLLRGVREVLADALDVGDAALHGVGDDGVDREASAGGQLRFVRDVLPGDAALAERRVVGGPAEQVDLAGGVLGEAHRGGSAVGDGGLGAVCVRLHAGLRVTGAVDVVDRSVVPRGDVVRGVLRRGERRLLALAADVDEAVPGRADQAVLDGDGGGDLTAGGDVRDAVAVRVDGDQARLVRAQGGERRAVGLRVAGRVEVGEGRGERHLGDVAAVQVNDGRQGAAHHQVGFVGEGAGGVDDGCVVIVHQAAVADPGVGRQLGFGQDGGGLPVVAGFRVGDEEVQSVAVGGGGHGPIAGILPVLAEDAVPVPGWNRQGVFSLGRCGVSGLLRRSRRIRCLRCTRHGEGHRGDRGCRDDSHGAFSVPSSHGGLLSFCQMCPWS
ncbi:hypothetical protein SAFG77S_03505 [Streptomyces afghaniensis]